MIWPRLKAESPLRYCCKADGHGRQPNQHEVLSILESACETVAVTGTALSPVPILGLQPNIAEPLTIEAPHSLPRTVR